MKIILFFLFIFVLTIPVNGQEYKPCPTSALLARIKKLPQVKSDSMYVAKKGRQIIYQIYRDTIAGKIYRVFKEAVNDKFHVSTLHLFYVDESCHIFLYDTIEDRLVPVNVQRKRLN